VIGVNAAIHALGVLAMALVLPRLVTRPRRHRRRALLARGTNQPWIAYPVLFLWSGVFVGIFTLMMTLVGSLRRRRPRGHLRGDGTCRGRRRVARSRPSLVSRWTSSTRPADLHRLGHARFHGLRSHKPQRGMIPRDWFSIKANRLLIAVVNGTMLRLIMRIIILTGLSL